MMTIATPTTYPAGTTVRFWAKDLMKLGASATPAPVTTGATVTFQIANLNNEAIGGAATGLVTQDDWYADMNVPDDPGPYMVKVTITVDAIVWKGSDRFDVSAF